MRQPVAPFPQGGGLVGRLLSEGTPKAVAPSSSQEPSPPHMQSLSAGSPWSRPVFRVLGPVRVRPPQESVSGLLGGFSAGWGTLLTPASRAWTLLSPFPLVLAKRWPSPSPKVLRPELSPASWRKGGASRGRGRLGVWGGAEVPVGQDCPLTAGVTARPHADECTPTGRIPDVGLP